MPDNFITVALGLPEVRVIREKETEQEIMIDIGIIEDDIESDDRHRNNR